MKFIIILILIIICYLLFFCNIVEKIENIQNLGYQVLDNYDNIYSNKQCCIISKKFVPNNFIEYDFKLNKGIDCPRNYNNNARTIFHKEIVDGEQFDMETCNADNEQFGSCRTMGAFECLDFVTKAECDKYNMVWSKETCSRPLPYTPSYPKWELMIDDEIREIG